MMPKNYWVTLGVSAFIGLFIGLRIGGWIPAIGMAAACAWATNTWFWLNDK